MDKHGHYTNMANGNPIAYKALTEGTVFAYLLMLRKYVKKIKAKNEKGNG